MKILALRTGNLLNYCSRWTRGNFKCRVKPLIPLVQNNKHFSRLLMANEVRLLHVGSRNLSFRNEQSTNPSSKVRLMEKLVHKLPFGLQPYVKLMRIDKPTGTWLILCPSYWGICLATPAGCLPDLTMLVLFASGAILMRGAGCTINDMLDRKIDAKVARTKDRPLASGQLSTLDAWMFLGGQLSLALLVLLHLNWYTIVIGASSLMLVGIYPLVKRISDWPQLILGLTMNWGIFMGWSALHGSCDWSVVLPLYMAGISWTLIYDTIYAHQDKVDDVILEIRSTALKFGEDTKSWLYCFALTSIAGFLTCGLAAQQTWPYFTSVAITSGLFLSQISSLNIHNPADCWEKFRSNQKIGWIICSGILCGTLLKSSEKNEHSETSNVLHPAEKILEKTALTLS